LKSLRHVAHKSGEAEGGQAKVGRKGNQVKNKSYEERALWELGMMDARLDVIGNVQEKNPVGEDLVCSGEKTRTRKELAASRKGLCLATTQSVGK